ncbi:MAG: hypothetical protein ACE5OT_03775 [Candidatus Hadarchaeaceae archaeon]
MAKAKRRKEPVIVEPGYRCLRCRKTMAKSDFPSTNVVVQVPGFASFKRANAYVCPKCGFVELYVE